MKIIHNDYPEVNIREFVNKYNISTYDVEIYIYKFNDIVSLHNKCGTDCFGNNSVGLFEHQKNKVNVYINDNNYKSDTDKTLDIKYILTHELKHLSQYKLNKEGYIYSFENNDDYMSNPYEIEAYEFADKIIDIEELNVDKLQYI